MTGEPADLDTHRSYLAALLAVLDGDCNERVHDLLCRPDPHHAVEVAHRLAHKLVGVCVDDDTDHEQMRADIAGELLQLAQDD